MALKEFEKPNYSPNPDIHPAWQTIQEKSYPALMWGLEKYHLMPGYRIKDEGMESLKDSIQKIKDGEQKPMSEMAEALRGFEVKTEGVEALEGLSDGRFFVVGNHSSEGPLRGLGETLLVSKSVKEATGKEIRWVQAMQGGSSPSIIHEQIAYTAGSILVRKEKGRDSVGKIFSSLREGNPVGIYPEGDKFQALHKGDERSGGLFKMAARKNIPLVLAGAFFENDQFTLRLDRINPEKIREIEKNADHEKAAREVVDYCMNRLARLLPDRKRGYYSNPENQLLLPDDGSELILT